MISIEKTGFLSEEIAEWIKKHRKENIDWFKLCEDINEFAHTTMFSITIHNKDPKELIVSSLYVRSMSNFQGSIIMAERGMINEAKVLLRCLLECMFAIVAIEKDSETINQFILEDLLQRKDYLKAYKRNKREGTLQADNAPSLEEIDDLLQDIEKKIEMKRVRKWQKRELARKGGLVIMYDTTYKLLSGSIHVNARDLEQYLEINEAGEVKRILWGPDIKEIDSLLFTAAESMLFVLTAISHLFDLSFKETWQAILKTYGSLGKQFYNQRGYGVEPR